MKEERFKELVGKVELKYGVKFLKTPKLKTKEWEEVQNGMIETQNKKEYCVILDPKIQVLRSRQVIEQVVVQSLIELLLMQNGKSRQEAHKDSIYGSSSIGGIIK
ncbi:MAG: hypothetical protein AMQ74_01625 [Candidatus Methanofastidiosum methylothiophilum]|uniref:Uncharacterized protein n=1 Tax=Candidatus Methanofastidiosum methylothiophilum TaxID=1705564 RepID=A0A150ITL0_9EURY|nr:MAG: hypothetical protein AMQ74_01625 [Candidatus Methanofastidiosum methylthiophilus]